MDELFAPESVTMRSPRLIWCERLGVTVKERPRMASERRFEAVRRGWHAWRGHGATAEEACLDLAQKAGVLNWKEAEWKGR